MPLAQQPAIEGTKRRDVSRLGGRRPAAPGSKEVASEIHTVGSQEADLPQGGREIDQGSAIGTQRVRGQATLHTQMIGETCQEAVVVHGCRAQEKRMGQSSRRTGCSR